MGASSHSVAGSGAAATLTDPPAKVLPEVDSVPLGLMVMLATSPSVKGDTKGTKLESKSVKRKALPSGAGVPTAGPLRVTVKLKKDPQERIPCVKKFAAPSSFGRTTGPGIRVPVTPEPLVWVAASSV